MLLPQIVVSISLALMSPAACQDLSEVNSVYSSTSWTTAFKPGDKSEEAILSLKERARIGDLNSQAHLNLLTLIGIVLNPLLNVREAVQISKNLAANGVPSAHMLLGFIIKHNLTTQENALNEVESQDFLSQYKISSSNNEVNSDVQREANAMVHFLRAATAGDPLAQMIIGDYYRRQTRCHDALEMYRKAALHALRTVPESTVTMFQHGPFIDQEDASYSEWPTQLELEYLEFEAKRGEPEAAMQAAALLLNEELGLPYNPEKAVEYLKIAIEAGVTRAMIYMAHLHIEGIVKNPDFVYARNLLERALDLGDPTAHAGYARYYIEGLSDIPKNFELAREHLNKGAQSGHVDSMFYLGQLYATSLDESDIAVHYWSVPAQHGHVHASWYSAEYYRNMLFPPKKIIGSNTKEVSMLFCQASVSFYRNVAQAGQWHHLLYAAYKDFKNDHFDASALKFMLLSDLGYSSAHVNLARLLQRNEITLYDSKESVMLNEFQAWSKAAQNFNPVGFLHLGHHYYYGIQGITDINKAEALENYRQASLLGNSEASFNLAYLYEWGEGVEQNTTHALHLYRKNVNSSEEAWVPSSLAIIRLLAYGGIRDLLTVNLYETNCEIIINSIIRLIQTPEILLSIIIVTLIFIRNR